MEVKKETKNEIVFKCPACGSGEIIINKRSKHQYGYCDICDAAYIHYVPLPHQLDVHKCKSKLKLLIGGMGSAKSRAGVMEIVNHALTVPNGKTIMMAQTLKQLSINLFYIHLSFDQLHILLNQFHSIVGQRNMCL